MAKRKVQVHYRRLCDRNFVSLNPTFQTCLEEALKSEISGICLADADAARITRTYDGKRMCLLSPDIYKSTAVGEIAIFREGDIPVAETDENGQLKLRTFALNGNELAVQGSSFFMAKGDHLALIHVDSTARLVEEYFRWILRAPIGPLPQDEIIRLVPLLSVGGKTIGLQEITSLTIKGAVHPQGELFPTTKGMGTKKGGSFRKVLEPTPLSPSKFRDVLSSFGLTSGALNQLSEDDLDQMQLSIVLSRKQKNKDIVPRDVIQAILNDGLERATEFRAPGTTRRGEAIVATFPGEVTTDGAYVEPNAARSLMWEALAAWEKQGLIS